MPRKSTIERIKIMKTLRLARGIAVLTVASVSWLAGPIHAQQPMRTDPLAVKLSSVDAQERIEAAEALSEARDLTQQRELLEATVAAMRDPLEEVRYLAVSAVAANAYAAQPGQTNALRTALPGLIERLDDPAARVREAAADALALVGTPPRATADLLALVDWDPTAAVRRAAIGALATLPVADGAVRDVLIDTLRSDPDATVRGEAAKAIAAHHLDDDEVVDALRQALEDSDEYVQQNAVRTLGLLGDRAAAAVSDLEALAADTDSDTVRKQAGYALRSIRGTPRESGRGGQQVRSEPMESDDPRQPAGSPPPPH